MSYYDGISSFKGYMRRVFRLGSWPYDWADLAPWERKKYADRDATPRERRSGVREP